jgi:hypothetical protein
VLWLSNYHHKDTTFMNACHFILQEYVISESSLLKIQVLPATVSNEHLSVLIDLMSQFFAGCGFVVGVQVRHLSISLLTCV